MALRAFKCNPSLGGFGTETNASLTRISGDAFPQIVKELVDNAIDACSSGKSSSDFINNSKFSNACESPVKRVYKRVRVKIEAEEFTTTPAKDGKGAETMDCLRITVSDNGVGMEDVDACVMVFSSNKNGGAGNKIAVKSKTVAKTGGGKKRNKQQSKPNEEAANGDGYTSGRYGIGLTLCLLHAQHLVPGSVTCITSTTSTSEHWVRSIYQVDMDADHVRCKKREELVKESIGECGTIVSLLVPGGEEAQKSWPRLAEYFARYQLSLDLACSLEVLAPSLCRRPLMIRPPAEMERRSRHLEEMKVDESELDNDEWDGNDGCDNDDESNDNRIHMPSVSKAVREREDAEKEKNKKMVLLCKAAEMYKGRPVSLKNVALEAHPIRRYGENDTCMKSVSKLEVAILVFGPESECSDSDDESVQGGRTHGWHDGSPKKSSDLQLVRMVNGIPLLDSPEAVACGLVQKISGSSSNWNSFGLDVSLKQHVDSVDHEHGETPTFGVEDSAQVAPFFRESTHGLFRGSDQSSDDDTDPKSITRKRKKAKSGLSSLLPAALRLGEMMMIVQIKAKPSALPLPTLSKGRLPLNDKGINDALENGITACLRSLQRTNPTLLLTAHQLKRIERDAKYVPAVAGAIASVLCRSNQVGLFEHAMDFMSEWDEEVKNLGIAPFDQFMDPSRKAGAKSVQKTTNHRVSAHEREMCKVEELRPLLERRLRFVVSEEFKDAKRDKARKEREDEAAERKKERVEQQRKQKRTSEADDMRGDCFASDESIDYRASSRSIESAKHNVRSDFGEMSSPERCGTNQQRADIDSNASEEPNPSLKRVEQGSAAAIPAAIHSPENNFDCRDGLETDDENDEIAISHVANVDKTDGISSEDDWSEQFGIVVPGSYFR